MYINVPIDEIIHCRVINEASGNKGIAFKDGETRITVFLKRNLFYEKYIDVTVDFENASNLESKVPIKIMEN